MSFGSVYVCPSYSRTVGEVRFADFLGITVCRIFIRRFGSRSLLSRCASFCFFALVMILLRWFL